MEPIQIENLEDLKKRISNAGFSKDVIQSIEDGLAAGQTEIRPFVSEVIENKRMDFEPEIKIKDAKGYYNGFKSTFYNEDGTTVSQWFKASDRITVNEAYILLMDQQHPRAVLKTYYNDQSEKYGQWVQLDFSQKTEAGNFLTKRFNDYDLAAKLNDFEFTELKSDNQKLAAAAFMAEGREIQVSPVNQEKYNVVFMRANPERNTVTFMDQERNPLYHDQFRTQAARERAQQAKNTRQANVNFVRESKTAPSSEAMPSSNESKSHEAEPPGPDSETRKTSKKSRIVQEIGQHKGKSI